MDQNIECIEKRKPSEIKFSSGEPHNTWIMKLNDKGIFFNKESYPYSQADDFAKAIIEILERNFDVTFHRKKPPYEKRDN